MSRQLFSGQLSLVYNLHSPARRADRKDRGTVARMDGLPETLKPAALATCQRTLKTAISCVGTGLHSGQRVNLGLHPAAPGTGIIFRRTIAP